MTSSRLSARNPRSGVHDYEFEPDSMMSIAEKCRLARAAQSQWRSHTAVERAHRLQGWAKSIAEHRDEIVAALVADTGRYSESLLEVDSTIAGIERWSSRAGLLDNGSAISSGFPGIDIEKRQQAFPLVGIISPWNFPLLLALIDAIPALMAGCAVAIKPSEVTPRFMEPLQAAIDAAGLSDIVVLIAGDGAAGASLLEHIDMVVFTGSTATGRKVAQSAAEKLIPAFLEMGGKDPAIVTETADIPRAAASLTWGSMANAGQSCLSIERVFVHESRYEELVAALTQTIGDLRLNLDGPEAGEIGPVIAERQIDIVNNQLQDALANGARAHCGGALREQSGGTWCQPTLLTEVSNDMLVMREETFAAILPVMPYADTDEALALANSTQYGLSAAVFSGTAEDAQTIAAGIEAGAISINDCALTAIIHEGEKQSFKASGVGGSRMGKSSLQRFLRKQAHIINSQSSWDPWWFGGQEESS